MAREGFEEPSARFIGSNPFGFFSQCSGYSDSPKLRTQIKNGGGRIWRALRLVSSVQILSVFSALRLFDKHRAANIKNGGGRIWRAFGSLHRFKSFRFFSQCSGYSDSPKPRTQIKNGGGRIWTFDLRVMSPASYLSAPPRNFDKI